MKQATVLVLLVLTTYCSIARPLSIPNDRTNDIDSPAIKKTSMQQLLKQVIDASGITEKLELREGDVLNIEAKISHGKKYIVYNPDFIADLNTVSKNDWCVIALLAHEVGHHISGHTHRKGGSKPKLELKADEFAGFILNRLGATLQESQHVMFFIAKTKASKTHPSRQERLQAIERGWNEGTITTKEEVSE